MVKAVLRPGRHNRFERRGFLYLVVATIPGALAVLLENRRKPFLDANPNRHPPGDYGYHSLLADRLAKHQRRLPGITRTDAILIGLSQALAIMPGVSRSGSTMTMGLFLGFTRETVPGFLSYCPPPLFRSLPLTS